MLISRNSPRLPLAGMPKYPLGGCHRGCSEVSPCPLRLAGPLRARRGPRGRRSGGTLSPVCGLQSPDLSAFGVGVVADEVGVQHLLEHLGFALTEGLLVLAAYDGLVHYRHRGLLSPLLLSVIRALPAGRGG